MDQNTFSLLISKIDDLKEELDGVRADVKSLLKTRDERNGSLYIITTIITVAVTILVQYFLR